MTEEEVKEDHTEDIEWESKPESLFTKLIRTLVIFMVIGGLVYISGIYQTFLYDKTPESITQEEMASMVDAKTLSIPLNVFIISGDELLGSERDVANVLGMVENASRIWSQAGIDIEVKNIKNLNLPEEDINTFYENPSKFINTLPGFEKELITAILLKHIRGINGIAFGGARSIAVADYTTSYDFRVFAHEIGHVLGLGHVLDKTKLMHSGSTGKLLTLEEVLTARENAQYFY